MRRLLFLAAVLTLVGCQGDGSRYDTAALKEARKAARSYVMTGKLVSVGQPVERKLCDAPTYHADPCIAVPTVHQFRKWKIHGDVFVWLERNDGHEWRVVDTDYFTPEITVTIRGADGGSSIAPPWATGLP